MIADLITSATGRSDRANPMSLFISLIRENPRDGIEAHKRKLRALLLEDGYEDFLDAVIDEWQRIKYSTAHAAALPPSVAQITQKQAAKREIKEKTVAQVRAATVAAKAAIGARLIDMIMPNEKKLGDCTGAECLTFGSFYTKIGAALKPDQLVASKFTGDSLAKLLKRA